MKSDKNISHSDYYLNKQLNIDKTLIRYRFDYEKRFFKGESCLEMGPADGVMTEKLSNVFETLHIVDGDKKLLNVIENKKNIVKFHSWFENFIPPTSYDTIIMEHILEHVDNPKEIIDKAKNWLKKEGVIIAGVPNAKSIHRLAAVKMGLLKTEYHLNARDISQGHKRVYDLKSFEKEFLACDLKIVHKGGVFIKPLSFNQIEKNWTADMIDGFYKLGYDFPEITADLVIVATK
jgi:2-polyprenyl-3-methyl-5-hydroxy-6-metoxy-1,4-benzoquinol methylase